MASEWQGKVKDGWKSCSDHFYNNAQFTWSFPPAVIVRSRKPRCGKHIRTAEDRVCPSVLMCPLWVFWVVSKPTDSVALRNRKSRWREKESREKREREEQAFPLRRTGPKLSLTSSSNYGSRKTKMEGRVSHCFLYYHHNILGGRELVGKTLTVWNPWPQRSSVEVWLTSERNSPLWSSLETRVWSSWSTMGLVGLGTGEVNKA